jgi:hypothetical protein
MTIDLEIARDAQRKRRLTVKAVASILLGKTVLKCRGAHPYAGRLPDRFYGRMHDVQIGFPVPFLCEPTGRVWRRDDPPMINTTNGKLLIHAECNCGAVTEFEVVRSKGVAEQIASGL